MCHQSDCQQAMCALEHLEGVTSPAALWLCSAQRRAQKRISTGAPWYQQRQLAQMASCYFMSQLQCCQHIGSYEDIMMLDAAYTAAHILAPFASSAVLVLPSNPAAAASAL
jgi:hypothetical protein